MRYQVFLPSGTLCGAHNRAGGGLTVPASHADGFEIGFDWVRFGGGRRFGLFTYSFVLTEFTFILAFRRLGLIGFELGLFCKLAEGRFLFIILCHKRTYVYLVI